LNKKESREQTTRKAKWPQSDRNPWQGNVACGMWHVNPERDQVASEFYL